MPAHFAAVVFDLDGTLLDTAPDFVLALNQMRRKHNKPELSYEIIREQVSNGAAALVKLGFNVDTNDQEFAQLRQELLDHYIKIIGQHSEFFPAIEALLTRLHDLKVPWGIATNKPRLYTDALFAKLQLSNPPNIIVCPEDVRHRKPDPESLFVIADQLNVNSADIIYLGDHRRDIECGNAAGSTTIACSYGYIESVDPAETWGANFLVQDSRQLPDLIEHLLTTPREH
ncbi:HAD-IA family hydrolase [Gilvimarinus sp. SDUM040013]|uniref:HAD-IA family hydrolase n=1 Tax=Gilvimarinus gilvus TaxID=3058038 RepID=A0ABU4RU52_9GAMM|nr:HAD-IA family hydrolase [Gilvimarinus sp. SDUM040013]MDO3385030.1 HAD-IA family hydrolase [Gilvimarinus sp. SDUM040013]MDX6848405.1 HAD-IA family hydrolase [Gilvimarinus sp. SDUM040013]